MPLLNLVRRRRSSLWHLGNRFPRRGLGEILDVLVAVETAGLGLRPIRTTWRSRSGRSGLLHLEPRLGQLAVVAEYRLAHAGIESFSVNRHGWTPARSWSPACMP